MISPKLYKSSQTYDFLIRLLGYERGIDRFLRNLAIETASECRILDAGCGTGLLGLHFLERFPNATLVATDLEPNFLHATQNNAERRGIDPIRMTLGTSDISAPQNLTTLDGATRELEEASFNVICTGAVLGYADDTERSVRSLLRLLVPGGYLINVEMNEGLVGRFVSSRYHYRNISLARMSRVIEDEGCEVSRRKLRLTHLPANLTRVGIVARKQAG